jgi:hypothetical protein
MWGIVGKVYWRAFQRYITYGPCDRFMTCRNVCKISYVPHDVRCRWKGLVKSFLTMHKICTLWTFTKHSNKKRLPNLCKTFIKLLKKVHIRSENVHKKSWNVHQTFWKDTQNVPNHKTFWKDSQNVPNHKTFWKRSQKIHKTFPKKSQKVLKTFKKRSQSKRFQANRFQNVLNQNVVETFSIETFSKRSQSKRSQNVLNQNALKTFTKRFQQIVHYTLAFPLWFRPLVIPVLNGLFHTKLN